jgi:hypothetical protein
MAESAAVLDRIRALKEENPRVTLEQIAATLNSEGLSSPGGGNWWPSNVSTAMQRAGIETARAGFSDDALDRILKLRGPDGGMGLSEIGETLTNEGVLTPNGGRWWPATVRKALQNLADTPDDPRADKARQALSAHGKRKTEAVYQGRRKTDEAILDRIVSMRRSGTALHEIADILTEEGVPTTRGGRRWWQSTVRSALHAAGYAEE